MLKNKKLLISLVIILIVIIAGLIIMLTKGMNYNLIYGSNTSIELYLETEFEGSDVESIIKESFGNDITMRQVNNLENDILIVTKSASDEQINTLVSTINEKYGLELASDDLIITNNTNITMIDLISPYIWPVCIASILILIYFIIKYRKLNILNVILFTLVTIIVIQLLYFSIYAIIRLPVNQLTMPISMLIYAVSIIPIIEKLENDLAKLKLEQK